MDTTAADLPADPLLPINYDVVWYFAQKHKLSYNEVAAMVRRAFVSPAAIEENMAAIASLQTLSKE